MMLPRSVTAVASALALALLPACADSSSPEDNFACTALSVPGIDVEIRSAVSGTPIADSARGVARDGAFVDSLRPGRMLSNAPSDLLSRKGAYARAGTYTIRIERAGYQPWDTTGIRVQAGRCNVTTARMVAHLIPIP